MFSAYAIEASALEGQIDAMKDRPLPEGIAREVAFLQKMPGGDLVVLAHVGDAAGTIPAFGPVALPRVERMFSAMPEGLPGSDIYISALPLLPGMRERFRAFAAELDGPRNPELILDMMQSAHGETVFLQNGATDYVVPIVIGHRPWEDEHRAAPNESELNLWINGNLEEMHGIDFADAPPPPNTLLWDRVVG
ncbi:hypothetical protein [Acidimangrovimonas sediminis]|uniref:hypothetical protein n=1 Tax=Acidimangrovimonas sediminis TaxID=2056283 RepID=UPI000C804E9F|nr:hypothetical protein [Acidimangrovimonas sediminis]